MTIEATLAALLREQREANALLRRLVEAKTGRPVPRYGHDGHTFQMPTPTRTGDPVNPTVRWAQPITTGDFVSPVTTGDGGTHRVGWQGNGMVGP